MFKVVKVLFFSGEHCNGTPLNKKALYYHGAYQGSEQDYSTHRRGIEENNRNLYEKQEQPENTKIYLEGSEIARKYQEEKSPQCARDRICKDCFRNAKTYHAMPSCVESTFLECCQQQCEKYNGDWAIIGELLSRSDNPCQGLPRNSIRQNTQRVKLISFNTAGPDIST